MRLFILIHRVIEDNGHSNVIPRFVISIVNMATRDALGFVGTIDENEDIVVEPENSDSEDEVRK